MNNNYLITNYYVTHRHELLAYASTRLGGSSADAEDVVQNVFLRLLTSNKLISEQTLPALVYTTTRNIIIDIHRRRNHASDYEHYVRKVCSAELSADSVCSMHEMIEQMERGMARLPENVREVYRLHILDGMKVSEISERLDCNYKSVEHRLGAARKAVRSYLAAI